jgi:hypothetical protein
MAQGLVIELDSPLGWEPLHDCSSRSTCTHRRVPMLYIVYKGYLQNTWFSCCLIINQTRNKLSTHHVIVCGTKGRSSGKRNITYSLHLSHARVTLVRSRDLLFIACGGRKLLPWGIAGTDGVLPSMLMNF